MTGAGDRAGADRERVGTEVVRIDGPLKVTGRARYAADNNLAGLAHGYLLLATVGRGTIRSMQTRAAEQAPGVLAVFTPFRPLKLFGGTGGFVGENRPPLQDTDVRYRGQVIGVVVAETYEQARDAAGLVRASYREQAPKASFADGIAQAVAPAQVSGEPATVDILAAGVGSIDEALAASEVRVTASFRQPVKDHAAMEPHAAVATWRDGHLTVYSATQAPTDHARSIAAAVGVDGTKVHVVNPFVGGAFGGKYPAWAHTLLAAAAARAVGRPVKIALSREQVFTATGHRGAVAQTVTLGATRGGTLTAVKHEAVSALSNSGTWYDFPAHATTRALHAAANIHIGQKVVPLDLPPTTIMRAVSEEPGSFAIETAMDELAVALRMDPVELRLRNYSTAVAGGLPWSSKHLDECYRLGAEKFGWAGRDATARSHVDGDWLVGTGMSAVAYPGLRFPGSARVRLQADGTAAVAIATSDAGTGMWTALALVGAHFLGLPVARVTPDIGDSALPASFGAAGSSGTVSAAAAVQPAADAAIRDLLRLAGTHERSPFHGRDPAELRYQDGSVVAEDRSIGFGALLTQLDVAAVEATAAAPPGPQGQFAFWSFGAHFCEMRVNRWTGEPRLARLVTVIDAGTIVNPTTARNQIVGSVVWGVGHALLESMPVERDGRFAHANFADYLLPVSADIPTVDVHFLDHPDTRFFPLGNRGIGELGLVGAAAAIGNAVHHATGRRIRELPITLDKLIG